MMERSPYPNEGGGPTSSSFPTYQISFAAEDVGKHIAASKRIIRWRFGFPNKDAIDSGETGPACRGSEHEVVIIWSITSGKKVIMADGQEVHLSMGRVGTFTHSWSMRGNHVVKIEVNVTIPEGARQYNLWVDGLSFFRMPKVFQLGIKGAAPLELKNSGPIAIAERFDRQNPPPGRLYDSVKGQYIDPPKTAQEDEDLRRAIEASLEESRHYLSSKGLEVSARSGMSNPATVQPVSTPAPKQEDLLIDFFSDPVPATMPSIPPAASTDLWGQSYGGTMVSYAPPAAPAPAAYPSNNELFPSQSAPPQFTPGGNQFFTAPAPVAAPAPSKTSLIGNNPFDTTPGTTVDVPKANNPVTTPGVYGQGHGQFSSSPFFAAPIQQSASSDSYVNKLVDLGSLTKSSSHGGSPAQNTNLPTLNQMQGAYKTNGVNSSGSPLQNNATPTLNQMQFNQKPVGLDNRPIMNTQAPTAGVSSYGQPWQQGMNGMSQQQGVYGYQYNTAPVSNGLSNASSTASSFQAYGAPGPQTQQYGNYRL